MASASPSPSQDPPPPESPFTKQNTTIEGDPSTIIKPEINDYIQKCIDHYLQGNQIGQSLYYDFWSDFELWDNNAFSKASNHVLQRLRNTLLDRGVYTPKDKTKISTYLYKLLVNDYTL